MPKMDPGEGLRRSTQSTRPVTNLLLPGLDYRLWKSPDPQFHVHAEWILL